MILLTKLLAKFTSTKIQYYRKNRIIILIINERNKLITNILVMGEKNLMFFDSYLKSPGRWPKKPSLSPNR